MTKITKKNCYQLLVYFLIIVFASCENPVVPEVITADIVGEESVVDVEPEIIIEEAIIIVPEIELTLYSLQGVQRAETKSPIEINRYVIDTTEYIQMFIELDGKDYFLFMGDNMFNNFGIDPTSMTENEYNIVIEIVGLFPGISIKELQDIY